MNYNRNNLLICIVCSNNFYGGNRSKYCPSCSCLSCIWCGKKVKVVGKRRQTFKYCSLSCHGKANPINQSKVKRNYGKDHPRWNPKGTLRKDGYILVTTNSKRYFQHRYVMEKFIGRKLKRDETIHHINHDRSDNRIENLELLSRSEHTLKYHTKGKHF